MSVDGLISENFKERNELLKDIKDIQKEAFKGFVKKAKVKNVEEYEEMRINDYSSKVHERKNELLSLIQKCEAEI